MVQLGWWLWPVGLCAVNVIVLLCNGAPWESNSTGESPSLQNRRPRHIQLLTFGDSLTQGYCGDANFHPYSIRLSQLLTRVKPNHNRYNVTEEGLSGERALHMPSRLRVVLDAAEAAGVKYDWILILAGINDILGDGRPAGQTLPAVQQLYQMARAHGASIFAMTLMEVAWLRPGDQIEKERLAFNAIIRKYFAAQGGDRHMHLYDLELAFPYFSIPSNDRNSLWVDGLHPTAKGYDVMAERIYSSLHPLLPGPRWTNNFDAQEDTLAYDIEL